MGVALTLVTHAAFAAIQYEFIQTSRSDAENSASDLSARAVLDGRRSRVDFLSGNAYPAGTYVIRNGSSKLLFVDPTQKSYTELNTLSVASAIGTAKIDIQNLTSTVTRLDDVLEIAGIPADHYRLTMTYDITIIKNNMALKQGVRTVVDKWTTVRFGDALEAAVADRIQTGNQQVDDLIAAELTKIKGFPLKQSVQITTIDKKNGKPARSELKLPPVRTTTRELTVTSIREMKADDALFRVPAEYRKFNFAEQAPKSQMQILSFDPPGK